MKALIQTVAFFVLFAAPPALLAQWPSHPTPRVPRTADGEPDLAAATPRTPDGKPDLSGIWVGRGGGRGGQAPSSGPPVATFGNAGANFPDGLPFQPWARELMEQRRAERSKDNPDALCLPMGLLQFHLQPQPRKIVQTPELILIIYEANYGLRQIFLDGRRLPDNDPQPWWYGYSVGRWEGDTLVVDTTSFVDDGWLDVRGSPTTGALRMTERFRRPNFGQLEIDVTIDDPKAYTQPFTVRVNQRAAVDTELIEFICHENQQFRTRIQID